jgi:type I restriction enzyme M protein
MALTPGELESKLWRAADILRGQIDSADYRSYIFSMLFLKRLSESCRRGRRSKNRGKRPR